MMRPVHEIVSRSVLLLVSTAGLAVGAAAAQEGAAAPREVTFTSPGLMPEGIEYDAAEDRFLLSSLSQGTISAVTMDGTLTPFVEDETLATTAGIEIDEGLGRLLVTNADFRAIGDPEVAGIAELLAYDLVSGERLFHADLDELVTTEGARFLANDVAVDADGNAYVTNSFAPIIFRVTVEGTPEIFIEDERLSGEFVGLNGIVLHPDGYLLVAVAGAGELYKVPLEEPEALARVELSDPLGFDGMVLDENRHLVGVAFLGADLMASPQAIVQLASDDAWASAEVVAQTRTEGAATTLALRDGVPYYVNTHLDEPEREQYEIVRADLAP